MPDNRRSGYLETELNLEDDFQRVVAEMIAIYKAKNKDYVGELRHKDILAGFRSAESFGMTVFQSCLIRMHDKFNRLKTLYGNKEKAKVNETLRDTLIDFANYAIFSVVSFDELYPLHLTDSNILKYKISFDNAKLTIDYIDMLEKLFDNLKDGFCEKDFEEKKLFRFTLFQMMINSIRCLIAYESENGHKIESKVKKLRTKPDFTKELAELDNENELEKIIKNI